MRELKLTQKGEYELSKGDTEAQGRLVSHEEGERKMKESDETYESDFLFAKQVPEWVSGLIPSRMDTERE